MGHISVINDETMAKTHSLTFIVSNKRQITTELKCLSRVTNNIQKENVKHRKTRKKQTADKTHISISVWKDRTRNRQPLFPVFTEDKHAV